MTAKQQTNIVNYLVICISDFAAQFDIDAKEAFRYLSSYGGIAFLMEHYEVEHTLCLDETIEALVQICHKNGGILA
jgi:hypothetical protein